jgi:hypothetical protein
MGRSLMARIVSNISHKASPPGRHCEEPKATWQSISCCVATNAGYKLLCSFDGSRRRCAPRDDDRGELSRVYKIAPLGVPSPIQCSVVRNVGGQANVFQI